MTFKTIATIKQLLESEVSIATDSIRMFTESNNLEDVVYWNKRLEAAQDACYDLESKLTEDFNLWESAEFVKRMLYSCMDAPGATITIAIKKDNGEESSAELYDHAALVQGLIDALDYFQDEID